MAVCQDHIEVVKTLVSLMKNPNFALRVCETPLYKAVKLGHVEIVKILVSVAEDPNLECQIDCPAQINRSYYLYGYLDLLHHNSPIIRAAKNYNFDVQIGKPVEELQKSKEIIRILAPYVKKRSDWEWLQVNGLWPDGVVFENGSNGKSNKKLILEQ